MKPMVGLCITLDDAERPVCIACAEKVANDGGYPLLFWMAHRPWKVDAATKCACGLAMGSKEAQDAAGRVADLMKPNNSVSLGADAGGHVG